MKRDIVLATIAGALISAIMHADVARPVHDRLADHENKRNTGVVDKPRDGSRRLRHGDRRLRLGVQDLRQGAVQRSLMQKLA